MAIHIKYAPILHLRILHDAELDMDSTEWQALPQSLKDQRSETYNIHDYLRIKPSADFQKLMIRHRLRIQQTPYGITLFAEVVDDPNTPDSHLLAFPLEENTSFRFYLDLVSRNFPSTANLPLNGVASQTLYLTNKYEHQEQGELHLTQKLPAFDPQNDYQPGDLVVDDDTNPTILFEAIKALKSPTSLSTDNWRSLPAPSFAGGTDYTFEDKVMHEGVLYQNTNPKSDLAPPSATWTEVYTPLLRTGVSPKDHVQVLGPALSFPVKEEITFAKATLFSGDPEITVDFFTFFHSTGENLSSLSFDLREYPAGFYRLEATDSTEALLEGLPTKFYLDPSLPTSPPFGIIELFPESGTHSFLNDQGHILAPTFHVRFRKRHTFWRYHFSGDLKDIPRDDGENLKIEGLQIDPDDHSRYVSMEIYPLTSGNTSREVSIPLVEDENEDDSSPEDEPKLSIFELPFPEFTNVTSENTKYYSDIFIHI